MNAQEMGRLGGKARARNLSAKRMSEIGRIGGINSGFSRRKKAAKKKKKSS
jgi:general stress protein YciG